MKYINSFAIFEGLSLKDDLMGRILHLYGSIPVPKEKSSVVISKIIQAEGLTYNLGDPISLNYTKLHDKVRFNDYFDSLLNSKDSRGHNFEGFIVGIFNGTFTQRGSKPDVTIDNKKYSVKFIDKPTKAPEVGRFKYIFANKDGAVSGMEAYYEYINKFGGIVRLCRLDNEKLVSKTLTARKLKEEIADIILAGIDGWIIAYPDSKDEDKIEYNVFDKEVIKSMMVNGKIVASKSGLDSHYAFALSATFRNNANVTKNFIQIPTVTIPELKRCLLDAPEQEWGLKVFGNIAYKMRPDVLRYIKRNAIPIIKNLSEEK